MHQVLDHSAAIVSNFGKEHVSSKPSSTGEVSEQSYIWLSKVLIRCNYATLRKPYSLWDWLCSDKQHIRKGFEAGSDELKT